MREQLPEIRGDVKCLSSLNNQIQKLNEKLVSTAASTMSQRDNPTGKLNLGLESCNQTSSWGEEEGFLALEEW